jgi:hypothetical protein
MPDRSVSVFFLTILVVVGAYASTSELIGGSPTDVISNSFDDHILQLNSRNVSVSAILSQYEANATVIWIQHGPNNQTATGGASGATNIHGLLYAFFGVPRSVILANVTRTISVTGNHFAMVNSSFDVAADSEVFGHFSSKVSALDSYAYSASTGTWLISQETWDFLNIGAETTTAAT